jgi:two-component system sensor histidine kinase/response regulator
MHDLQTPVAVLEVTLKLLEEDLSFADEETRATLRGAQRAARRIQQHIDHRVTSERLSSGRLVPRIQKVDLAVILKELIADYGDQGKCVGVLVELDLDPKARLPLRADPILLGRIFQNLLENALRHVDMGGRVLIRARRGSTIEVQVCNDGPAISPTERSGLFAKIPPAARASTSSGLGLKFCRLAVAAHGGTIVLEENSEWPTCFVVRLPLAFI